MANSRLSKKKVRRTTEMQFEDIKFDDDWLADEEVNGMTEILDEDFVQVNQNQIEEDGILVHNLEDEHDGGRDENEFEDDFEDENEYEGDDGEESEDAYGIDDTLGDYDKFQHELFGN
ncbi:hypothetical protein P8452_37559 [Trifolium repens]|nr:hypothetical protein P8452_37559 [Trifolium repens]